MSTVVRENVYVINITEDRNDRRSHLFRVDLPVSQHYNLGLIVMQLRSLYGREHVTVSRWDTSGYPVEV
jgi:hypothetical protein